MSFVTRILAARSLSAGLLAGLVASALLVLMARAVIDHVPLYDELLHFLSAQGLLRSGIPAIADGVYERAQLYTRLVAAFMGQWGETLVVARSTALVGGVLLTLLLAVWITRQAGVLAGVSAATILVLVPTTLELAVFIRFYTLHALLIVVIAMLAYAATAEHATRGKRVLCGVFAVALLAPAWHFQETSAIAAGAVVLGVMAVLILDHWQAVRAELRRRPWQISAGLLAVAVVGVAFIYAIGFFDRLASAPQWASGSANRPHFYLIQFAREMPLLWPLFPLAAVIALRTHRRLALFCLVVLLAGLAVHSLAAAKSSRYVYYLFPFYAAVWGCAVGGLLVGLVRSVAQGSAQSPRLRLVAPLAVALLALALSQEGQRALRTAVGKAKVVEVLDYAVEADWSTSVAALKPIAAVADRVVTSNAMKSIFYLGRYDYELNLSIVEETETAEEFGRDIRTGGFAIGTAESTSAVLNMPGLTLVVLEDEKIGKESGVPAAAMEIIRGRCMSLALPGGAGISAWQCQQGAVGPAAASLR